MINNYVTDSLEIGTKLNNYIIQSVLGRGAFGITYLALDEDLEHLVAIKEYLPQELAMRDADNTVHSFAGEKGELFRYGLESFLREARTIVKFRHPNIVSVLTLFRRNNTAYMVMEYEDGKTLKNYVKDRQNISQQRLLGIFSPINDGLLSVHHRGYIHRDIKPDNIVIREDNTPVLIDFGTARDTLNSNSDDLTQIFTNGYAPFEQCHPTWAKQGPWTDIYSLGATLYFAITGKRIIAAQLRMLNDPYEPLVDSRYNNEGLYSTSFLKAIDDALSFQPKARPQSLEDWNGSLNLVDEYENKNYKESSDNGNGNDNQQDSVASDVPNDLELAMARAVTIDAKNIDDESGILGDHDKAIHVAQEESNVTTKALNLKLAFTTLFLVVALLVPFIYYFYVLDDASENSDDQQNVSSGLATEDSSRAYAEKNMEKELPMSIKNLIRSAQTTFSKTNSSFSDMVDLCNTLNKNMNGIFYQELRETYLQGLKKTLALMPKTSLKKEHEEWMKVQQNNITKNKAGVYEVNAAFKKMLLKDQYLYGSLHIESPSVTLTVKIAGSDSTCTSSNLCKTPVKNDKIRAGEKITNFTHQQKKINIDNTINIHPNQNFILYLK